MIHSDEIQKLFREKQFIAENEIVITSGDLVLAENVLTRERRLLDKNIVQTYLNSNNIRESKSTSQLLKG